MAELVFGALGIVPLIGIAIKSYRGLCSDLRTFRHCSSTVKNTHKKLKVQRIIFENECELLLRDCLGDDADLQTAIDQGHEMCAELIQSILEAVQQLDSNLACFQALKAKQRKGERMKETWSRLKDGVRITLNKNDYEAALNDLRIVNSDLQSLRGQVTQLQNPPKVSSLKRAATPPGWADIRSAARALHEGLIKAWSCSETSHLQHFVKLFLEAEKAEEDVRMDIAIMCHGYRRGSGGESLIQLQVRSGRLEWSKPPSCLVEVPPSGSGEIRPQKRAKTVRFLQESSSTYTISQASAAGNCTALPTLQTHASLDLGSSTDLCSEIRTRCSQRAPSITSYCLGHIDMRSNDNLRHSFYLSHRNTSRGICLSPLDTLEPVPMDAFLHAAEGGGLSTADRLKMARSLVLAVLKFNETPWLGDVWRLQDFSLFNQGQDVSQALQTLHLGAEFDCATLPLGNNSNTSTMEGVQLSHESSRLSLASEDERLLCGIENVTLHSLGVALLQIDRMEKIDPDDVLLARKAAKLSSSFGDRYQEITRKCLRCDFGYGTNLGKAQLQKAVYESVIGPLETMISVLSIEDDAG
ncbi:uncharacterized protein DNG_05187 [Cephalotrichum gorgonifer]|uniref:Uncharacterized protein n=1 Tax=Cephalotrichum gorgonifer TaxID=2041049 RepID=A0AAE8MZH3_9PEZI|nr:uncharacterized protein DNG_05187 [Cephalotrichum gorgonifer]